MRLVSSGTSPVPWFWIGGLGVMKRRVQLPRTKIEELHRKEQVMFRQMVPVVLCASLLGIPALTGCEKKISEETTTVRKSDGTVSQEKKEVTRNPDGTVTEKKVERTNNP